MESPLEQQQELYPNGGPPLLVDNDDDAGIRRKRRRKLPPQQIPRELLKGMTASFGNACQLPGDYDADLAHRSLAAYSLLRTLSTTLRLSPFTPNVFLRALYLPIPTKLLGDVHVAVLRILLPHLGLGHTFRGKGSSVSHTKRRILDGIRLSLKGGDNLTFMDGLSWPLFCDDYCHLTADLLYQKLHDTENHIDYRYLKLQERSSFQDYPQQQQQQQQHSTSAMMIHEETNNNNSDSDFKSEDSNEEDDDEVPQVSIHKKRKSLSLPLHSPSNVETTKPRRPMLPMHRAQRVTETVSVVEDDDAKALRDFMCGMPSSTTTTTTEASSTAESENDDASNTNNQNYHWPQFEPLKAMRSGIPYHRLSTNQKLTLLEFLLDELLQVPIIQQEFTKRQELLDCYPYPYGVLPSTEEMDKLQNDDECGVCGLEGELLCCDGCVKSYHRECLDMYEQLPDGKWLCPECKVADPARFGPLRAGCKASLDWCTPGQVAHALKMQEANAMSSLKQNAVEETLNRIRSLPENHPMRAFLINGEANFRAFAAQRAAFMNPTAMFGMPIATNPAAMATMPTAPASMAAMPIATNPASLAEQMKSEPTSSQGSLVSGLSVAPNVSHPPATADATNVSSALAATKPPDATKTATSALVPTKPPDATKTTSALAKLATTTEAVDCNDNDASLDDYEFLIVHGFCFCRKRSQATSKPYHVLTKDKVEEHLGKFDKKIAQALPFCQIPSSQKVGDFPTLKEYFASSESYNPTMYSNKYRKSLMPQFIKPATGSHLLALMAASYENECHPSSTFRLSPALGRDMQNDKLVADFLKAQTSLFDPYEIIKGYMYKLETTLRKACLLNDFWESGMYKSVHDVWSSNVRKCKSLERLALLLVKLVDQIRPRAFLEGWFHNSLLKSSEIQSFSDRHYEELPANWDAKKESRKRRWERTPTDMLLHLCEKDACDLGYFVRGIRPDLLILEQATFTRSKRKKAKTSIETGNEPAVATKHAEAPSSAQATGGNGFDNAVAASSSTALTTTTAQPVEPPRPLLTAVNIDDIEAPQKPYPAYFQFANKRRQEIKDQNPTASSGEISKILSNMWKQSSDEFKASFAEEEAKQRKVYKAAMEEYHEMIKARYVAAGVLYPGKEGATAARNLERSGIADALGGLDEEGNSSTRRSRRSGRVTRHSFEVDSHAPPSASIGPATFAHTLASDNVDLQIEQYKIMHIKPVEKILKANQQKENSWPVAGRDLFETVGDLSPREMRRLARNAGCTKAPYVAYHTSHEVGQICFAHTWRKKTEECYSFEELINQVRILESFLDRHSIHSFEGTARRGKSQFQKEVRCSQRDPETGKVFHFVVNKGRGKGCWMPEESMDVSTLTLEFISRKQKQIKSRHMRVHKLQEQERKRREEIAAKERAEKQRIMFAAQNVARAKQEVKNAQLQKMKADQKAASHQKFGAPSQPLGIAECNEQLEAALTQHQADMRMLLQVSVRIGIVPTEANLRAVRDKSLSVLKAVSAGLARCHRSLFLDDRELMRLILSKEKAVIAKLAKTPIEFSTPATTPTEPVPNRNANTPSSGFVNTAPASSAMMKHRPAATETASSYLQHTAPLSGIETPKVFSAPSMTQDATMRTKNGQGLSMSGGRHGNNGFDRWSPLSNQQPQRQQTGISNISPAPGVFDSGELSDLDDWQSDTASPGPNGLFNSPPKTNGFRQQTPMSSSLMPDAFAPPPGSSQQQMQMLVNQSRQSRPEAENQMFDFQKSHQLSYGRNQNNAHALALVDKQLAMMQPSQQVTINGNSLQRQQQEPMSPVPPNPVLAQLRRQQQQSSQVLPPLEQLQQQMMTNSQLQHQHSSIPPQQYSNMGYHQAQNPPAQPQQQMYQSPQPGQQNFYNPSQQAALDLQRLQQIQRLQQLQQLQRLQGSQR